MLLYEFPRATFTNYHKLCGSKQQTFLYESPGGRKSATKLQQASVARGRIPPDSASVITWRSALGLHHVFLKSPFISLPRMPVTGLGSHLVQDDRISRSLT